jgi:ABC-type uncharacterized transport system permease subunit
MPMLGAQGLLAGRNLYRATTAVIRDLGFSGFIRPLTAHKGKWRIMLTQILTGLHSVACYDTQGDVEDVMILTLQSSTFLFYVITYHFHLLMACTFPS